MGTKLDVGVLEVSRSRYMGDKALWKRYETSSRQAL